MYECIHAHTHTHTYIYVYPNLYTYIWYILTQTHKFSYMGIHIHYNSWTYSLRNKSVQMVSHIFFLISSSSLSSYFSQYFSFLNTPFFHLVLYSLSLSSFFFFHFIYIFVIYVLSSPHLSDCSSITFCGGFVVFSCYVTLWVCHVFCFV